MYLTNIRFLVDARRYDEIAAGIARDWLAGRSSQFLETAGPYQAVFMVTFLACFYVLTGGIRALPLLMALYSTITAYTPGVMYKIVRLVGGSPGTARATGWLVALCPAFVFWTGGLYKEGLILLVLSLGIYHTLRLQIAWQPRSAAVIGLCILALCGLRIYMALIVALAMCLGLMLGRTRGREPGMGMIARQAFAMLVFTIVTIGAGAAVQISESLPSSLEEGFAKIEQSRRDLATANSGYLRDVHVESISDAFQLMPLGLAYFVAVPLPWQLGSIRQNIAIPDTALWVFALYPLALIGAVQLLRRNLPAAVLLIVTAVAICCFYAIFIGNIGIAYRMRVQVWLLWAVFVGIGWETFRGRSPFTILSKRTVSKRVVSRLRRQQPIAKSPSQDDGLVDNSQASSRPPDFAKDSC